MRITREQFVEAGDALVAASDRCNDGWAWVAARDRSKAYIVKRTSMAIAPLPMTTDALEEEDDPAVEPLVQLDEDGAVDLAVAPRASTDAKSVVSLWEYHIVYSPVFEVPALYFRASLQDGSPMSPADISDLLHPELMSYRSGPFPAISQDDHPHLGVPYILLHPCGTSDLLEATGAPPPLAHALISWLSLVGPHVRLHIPATLIDL